MTTITSIQPLPLGPSSNDGTVNIVITPNVPSYFKVSGTELNKIRNITWYPRIAGSVEFVVRDFVLSNSSTEGTFMIKVINNFLSAVDRAGTLSIRLDDGDTISFPVLTYGPVSHTRLWLGPYEGLDTA